jgi:hypothetical protein
MKNSIENKYSCVESPLSTDVTGAGFFSLTGEIFDDSFEKM